MRLHFHYIPVVCHYQPKFILFYIRLFISFFKFLTFLSISKSRLLEPASVTSLFPRTNSNLFTTYHEFIPIGILHDEPMVVLDFRHEFHAELLHIFQRTFQVLCHQHEGGSID